MILQINLIRRGLFTRYDKREWAILDKIRNNNNNDNNKYTKKELAKI